MALSVGALGPAVAEAAKLSIWPNGERGPEVEAMNAMMRYMAPIPDSASASLATRYNHVGARQGLADSYAASFRDVRLVTGTRFGGLVSSSKGSFGVHRFTQEAPRPAVRRPPEAAGVADLYTLKLQSQRGYVGIGMWAVCGHYQITFDGDFHWKTEELGPAGPAQLEADMARETRAVLLAGAERICGKGARQVPPPAAAPKAPPPVAVEVTQRGAPDRPWQTLPASLPPGARLELRIATRPARAGLVALAGKAGPAGGRFAVTPEVAELDGAGRAVVEAVAPDAPGRYELVFVLMLNGEESERSATIALEVAAPTPLLTDGKRTWRPVPVAAAAADSLRCRLEQDAAVASVFYGGPVERKARELLTDPAARADLEAFAADELRRLSKDSGWRPSSDPQAAAARFARLFAESWKWGVDVNVKMTGNLLAEWPIAETYGQTFEVTGDVMRYTGVEASRFKVGDVLDKVGLAAAGIELWLGLRDAATATQQEEALNKFGFALTDATLGQVAGDLLGSGAGLATWYVDFLLSETRDALMAKLEQRWIDGFARWAIERHWVGRLSGSRVDRAAMDKVVALLDRGGNLEQAILQDLLDTLNAEDMETRTQIPVARGEGEAIARDLPRVFVRRLLHAEEMPVGEGSEHVLLTPRAFYAEAHRRVVNRRLLDRARIVAEALVRGEAVLLSRLDARRYLGRFRLVAESDPGVGLGGLTVRRWCDDPVEEQPSWQSAADGSLAVSVTGLDFDEDDGIVLEVTGPAGVTARFALKQDDLRRQ
ncbi:hypothetical protein [Tistlia consotensis]|uniref:hypothetical protein n=1 Tax=Tistlia consotensis TaxID=1321365 RepID=UPI0011805D3C|nr:hypothetical protein [Tistlia consotensis]